MKLDEDMIAQIANTRAKYEFITFVILEKDFVYGIVQNETPKILMIYQFDIIQSEIEKNQFLQYGDTWWWESARTIPINLFIGDSFDIYEGCLRGYSHKAIEDIIGPTFSLVDRYLKRIKRRKIDLIKNNSLP